MRISVPRKRNRSQPLIIPETSLACCCKKRFMTLLLCAGSESSTHLQLTAGSNVFHCSISAHGLAKPLLVAATPRYARRHTIARCSSRALHELLVEMGVLSALGDR